MTITPAAPTVPTCSEQLAVGGRLQRGRATAIRHERHNPQFHLWTLTRLGVWFDAACGITIAAPQMRRWVATDPAVRCKRCAAKISAIPWAPSRPTAVLRETAHQS